MEIALAVDNVQVATDVYASNFPNANVLVGDVASLLPGKAGEDDPLTRVNCVDGQVDLVVAGPPCQGHSDLNNHTRRSDPRNSLYLKVMRFVEAVTPQFVLIENVPPARRAREQVVQVTTRLLQGLGYSVKPLMIKADQLGLAQQRCRHLVVAAHDLDLERVPLLPPTQSPRTLRDVIGDLIDEHRERPGTFYTPSRMTEVNKKRAAYLRQHGVYDLPDSERPACHADGGHSYKSMYGRLRWTKPAQTITTGFGSMGQGRYLHPDGHRMITPHEAARIQGIPDFFSFAKATGRVAVQKLIGNAVPPVIPFELLSRLLELAAADGARVDTGRMVSSTESDTSPSAQNHATDD